MCPAMQDCNVEWRSAAEKGHLSIKVDTAHVSPPRKGKGACDMGRKSSVQTARAFSFFCGRVAAFVCMDEAGSQILRRLLSASANRRLRPYALRIQEYDRINLISRFVRFRHNTMSRRLPSPSTGGRDGDGGGGLAVAVGRIGVHVDANADSSG